MTVKRISNKEIINKLETIEKNLNSSKNNIIYSIIFSVLFGAIIGLIISQTYYIKTNYGPPNLLFDIAYLLLLLLLLLIFLYIVPKYWHNIIKKQ